MLKLKTKKRGVFVELYFSHEGRKYSVEYKETGDKAIDHVEYAAAAAECERIYKEVTARS